MTSAPGATCGADGLSISAARAVSDAIAAPAAKPAARRIAPRRSTVSPAAPSSGSGCFVIVAWSPNALANRSAMRMRVGFRAPDWA